jgi:trypanothione synthetase/amidase
LIPPTTPTEPTTEPDLDFDEPLGAAQGVIAYSNLDDYYFSGEKAYCLGVYTGFKYQCVEYARRYMLVRQRCIFGQCGPAAEIFNMTTVENVETGEVHPFIACRNKETKVAPAVGMTLIYAQSKKMPVGHVAVITYVSEDQTKVGIGEQNQASKAWKGKPYGRIEELIKNADGTWYLKESDPCLEDSLGWLYIEGEAGKLAAPLAGLSEEILST